MSLYIQPLNETIKALLEKQIAKHRKTDSGFDIPLLVQSIQNNGHDYTAFKLGIAVAAVDTSGRALPCLLLPRSSICKTPFRLCNSIGLVDAGYRGEVEARCDSRLPVEYEVAEGDKMFQLCRPDFLAWDRIVLTDELPPPPDDRGTGGFGSTN